MANDTMCDLPTKLFNKKHTAEKLVRQMHDLTFFANAISSVFIPVTIPKKVLMLELKLKLFPSMMIQTFKE